VDHDERHASGETTQKFRGAVVSDACPENCCGEAEAAQRTGGADGSGSVAELRWVPRLTGTNAVNLWSVFGGLSFPYPRITRQAFRF
jgi:hypothetical protein